MNKYNRWEHDSLAAWTRHTAFLTLGHPFFLEVTGGVEETPFASVDSVVWLSSLLVDFVSCFVFVDIFSFLWIVCLTIHPSHLIRSQSGRHCGWWKILTETLLILCLINLSFVEMPMICGVMRRKNYRWMDEWIDWSGWLDWLVDRSIGWRLMDWLIDGRWMT